MVNLSTQVAQLEHENESLRGLLEVIVDIYVANRGTEHEFIRTITTDRDSSTHKLFKQIMRYTGQDQ